MSSHENGGRAQHRVRGCMVHTIDMKALETHALEVLAAMYGTGPKALSSYRLCEDQLVIGYTDADPDQGTAWILVSEGVGWPEDENGRVTVYLTRSPMGGQGTPVPIPMQVLRAYINGTFDLADYIRAFGDRLENNFSIFYRKFTPQHEEVST